MEATSNKAMGLALPYSSPKPKAVLKKGAKNKSKSAPSTPTSPASPSSLLLALNIWQYSMLNHTWSRRTAATSPPQGIGTIWPLSLCGCLVGDDVACIALGRDDGTCIWALDLLSKWSLNALIGCCLD